MYLKIIKQIFGTNENIIYSNEPIAVDQQNIKTISERVKNKITHNRF